MHGPNVPQQDAGNLTGEIRCMAPMFHSGLRGIYREGLQFAAPEFRNNYCRSHCSIEGFGFAVH